MRLEVRVLLLVLVLGLLAGLPGAEGRHGTGGRKDHHHHLEHHAGGSTGGGGGGGHHRTHRAGRARREGGQPTASVITDTHAQEETTTTPQADTLKCETDEQCISFTSSFCNVTKKVCECPATLSIYIPPNQFCGAPALLNSTCEYTKQCTVNDKNALCENKQCVCSKDFELRIFQSNFLQCATQGAPTGPKMEPAMIGVLAGLALMFVIICVVLRLFSKARFRENRSIFNTPNPRLMNASLFKDSKLLSPSRGDRRGSRASVRAPSRAPSLTSVTRDSAALPRRSPTGSIVSKGRRGSSVSATSNAAPGSANTNAPSAPGSATSAPPAATAAATAAADTTAAKSQSPTKESKDNNETTVAIETVD